jgi:hypothetical protein
MPVQQMGDWSVSVFTRQEMIQKVTAKAGPDQEGEWATPPFRFDLRPRWKPLSGQSNPVTMGRSRFLPAGPMRHGAVNRFTQT